MKKLLLYLSLILLPLLGCITTDSDWNNRIGHFTYDQAVAELGQPKNSTTLPDGTRVAEWRTQRGHPASVGFGMDAAFSTPSHGESKAPRVVPATPDKFLRLSFATDGKLIAWQRIYR